MISLTGILAFESMFATGKIDHHYKFFSRNSHSCFSGSSGATCFRVTKVIRMYDTKRNTLVYLTYSDCVVEGSPENSVTAVAVDHATPIPVK